MKGPFALSIVELFNLCDKNVVRNPRAKLDFVIKIRKWESLVDEEKAL